MEYEKCVVFKVEWLKYSGIVDWMNKLIGEKSIYEYNYMLFIEYFFVGLEFFKLVCVVEDL